MITNDTIEITLTSRVDIYDLIGYIIDGFGYNDESIADFIKKLDMQFGSYDLSEELYEHFSKTHQECLNERNSS